jgi:hypothetical protein
MVISQREKGHQQQIPRLGGGQNLLLEIRIVLLAHVQGLRSLVAHRKKPTKTNQSI